MRKLLFSGIHGIYALPGRQIADHPGGGRETSPQIGELQVWLYHLTVALKPVAGLYWRLRLEGEVDAIPETGPLILAGNHTSFLDPWFLGPFLFPRPIRFLITRDWFDKNAFLRWALTAYNTLPVEGDPQATLESVCNVLDRGEVVAFYPEGRISYDGRIQRFRSGISYVAARSGATVLPLGMRGIFEAAPRTRRFPRPGKITITVGSPMRFPGSPIAGRPDNKAVFDFRDRLFREVCRLSGQEDLLTSAARAARASERGGAGQFRARSA